MSRPILAFLSLVVACGGTSPELTDPGADRGPGGAHGLAAADQPSEVQPAEVTGEETAAPATPIADEYRDVAHKIIDAALAEEDAAYARLAALTDDIGPRLSGSKALERAIAWAVGVLEEDGHENVRTEKVMVPHWVRGEESARILAPIERELVVIGLGGTVATPKRGLAGEVVVVTGWEDLKEQGEAGALKGKIVLFDTPLPDYDREAGSGYGDVAGFRVVGPSKAAALGAKGVLMRSVTAHSLRTPHTGTLFYEDGAPKIPALAVTVEDAELIARLVARGLAVRVRMRSTARWLPDAESANVIAELRGSETPEEVVVIGGHIDSWDVGQGAHDDATGCVMMMHALTVLRKLDLRPRRTIRVVLWTNEENGGRGSKAYLEEHAAEIEDHVMALESDSGGFQWRGFEVQGSDAALEQMRDIVTLLGDLGAADVKAGFSGADIQNLAEKGVSTLGQWVEEDTYFDIHHTPADTLDKVDPRDFVENVAAAAVVAYVIADMPARFGVEE